MHFLPKSKDTPNNVAMDLYSTFPSIETLTPLMQTKITYSSNINIINNWNKISDDLIARNANEVWGTHDWVISSTKQVKEMTV